MGFFIAEARAEAASGPEGGMFSFVMLLVFIGIFYFFLIRPQAKRAKEHRNMVTSLEKGDEVVTGGGVLGKITDLGDYYVLLEIADGVKIKVQRSAVGSLVPKGTFKSTL